MERASGDGRQIGTKRIPGRSTYRLKADVRKEFKVLFFLVWIPFCINTKDGRIVGSARVLKEAEQKSLWSPCHMLWEFYLEIRNDSFSTNEIYERRQKGDSKHQALCRLDASKGISVLPGFMSPLSGFGISKSHHYYCA